MSYLFEETILALGLLLGMLLLFELGRRYGVARRKADPDGVERGSGPVEAAIFALLGLLLAFTFSGAASRFEDRRHLITEEANAISTAYLRIDLLPPDTRPGMRQLFVRYLNTRTDAYRNAEDEALTNAKALETAVIQGEIWSNAVAVLQRPDTAADEADQVLIELRNLVR